MDINSVPKEEMLGALYNLRNLYYNYLSTKSKMDELNDSYVSSFRKIDTKGIVGKTDIVIKSLFLGYILVRAVYGVFTRKYISVILLSICFLGIVFGTGDIGKNRSAQGKYTGSKLILKLFYAIAVVSIVRSILVIHYFNIYAQIFFIVCVIISALVSYLFINKYNKSTELKNNDIMNYNRGIIIEYDNQSENLNELAVIIDNEFSWYPPKYMDLRVIDKVIETFECYRADNLKEAFNIVERDNEVASIINEIRKSSLEIQAKQDAIKRAIDINTAVTISNGMKLNNIANQIRKQNYNIEKANDLSMKQNSKLDALGDSISKLSLKIKK